MIIRIEQQRHAKTQASWPWNKSFNEAWDNDYQITLLGIGPMTDLACLVLHLDNNDNNLLDAVDHLVLLMGQQVGHAISPAFGATARHFLIILSRNYFFITL